MYTSLKVRRSTGSINMDQHSVRNVTVDSHTGSWLSFVYRLNCELESFIKEGSLEENAPSLFSWLTDERNLYFGCQVTINKAAVAGPDGIELSEEPETLLWEWCRQARNELRAGEYLIGKPRKLKLDKSSGGHREIHVFNQVDSSVKRAVLAVIHPVLDRTLMPMCHGGRVGYGLWSARKSLVDMFNRTGNTFLVVQDIKGAFDNVPLGRLFQIVRKSLPCTEICDLIESIVKSQPRKSGTRGISQGSVLSPILLNCYLSHFVDSELSMESASTAIRYIDDISLLCGSHADGHDVSSELSQLITRAGLKAKFRCKDAIHDLQRDQTGWLGHNIRIRNGKFTFEMTKRAWASLDAALLEHNDELSLPGVVKNWLNDSAAPTETCASNITRKINTLLRKHRQTPLPTSSLNEWIQSAKERWWAFRDTETPTADSYSMACLRKLGMQ